jgi:ketosteroid isomerase-like protein
MECPQLDDLGRYLVSLEERALARWCSGDPSGCLEISAADVVYFDPFIDQRIDGLAALSDYYEALRGKIRADRFEILNPVVQRTHDMAVLTFNFVSFGGNENKLRWNCTEVYRREDDDWKIIQTHWSFTNPKQ